MDVTAEEKQRIREKIEKLKQSKFKQQTLPAWRPVPTAMSTMLTFSVFSIVFLAIGIVLYVMSDQIDEREVQYDENCYALLNANPRKPGPACRQPFFNLSGTIQAPIYVYYQMDNFYQNHRRYVKSRDNDQLNGKYKTVDQLANCDPIMQVKNLWDYQKFNLNGVAMHDDDPAIPCGLVAKSFFNDDFVLKKKVGDAWVK